MKKWLLATIVLCGSQFGHAESNGFNYKPGQYRTNNAGTYHGASCILYSHKWVYNSDKTVQAPLRGRAYTSYSAYVKATDNYGSEYILGTRKFEVNERSFNIFADQIKNDLKRDTCATVKIVKKTSCFRSNEFADIETKCLSKDIYR